MKLEDKIELTTGDEMIKYGRDIMRIKFKTNDDLPLNKIVNIPVCVIIVSSVFREDNEYYLQVLLYDCLYEHEEDVNPLDI